MQQPKFLNDTPYYLIYYYGQEGTTITISDIDDTIDSLITITDDTNTIIGEKIHRANSGINMDIQIYPTKTGAYTISVYASQVTLSNVSNTTSIIKTFENKKEDPIIVDTDNFETISFLDNNYWFYYGCHESIFPETMIDDITSMTGGYNEWSDYQENDFLPDVFSSSNIFKILYTDNLLTSNIVDIHHRIRNLSKQEFNKLPTSLQYNLDSYYNLNTIWIAVEDTTNTLNSILVDIPNEYPLLEILRDSKKFTYHTDGNITSLPMDEATFLTTYYDNFDTLTSLGKAIVVELYYLHYNLDDSFNIYDKLLVLINSLESEVSNKPYNLMVSLYCFIAINKILKKKILDNSANTYMPDYWSN